MRNSGYQRVRLRRIYFKTMCAIADDRRVRGYGELQKIPIASLIAIQSRVYVPTVLEYAEHPNSYEPITVRKTSRGLLIWDGHHRVHALLRRGRKTVWARVYEVKHAARRN